MKYTAPSQLFYPFNFCSILNKKLFFVLLFGSFLLASNFAYAQLPQFDDFESGLGNWNDGGNDCRLDTNTDLNGNFNVRLRDGSSQSNTTSDPIDLTSYTAINFSFIFYANGMENGETFYLEYDDGGGYDIIADYSRGTDFNNGVVYSVSVVLSGSDYTFSTNSSFRIRCDANNNNDQVYIDDINITVLPPPLNDNCSASTTLIPGEFCTPTLGSTTYADRSSAGCVGIADDDVYYSFTATTTTHTIEVDPTTMNDAVIEVFDSCGGTSLGCEDSTSGSSSESLTINSLTIGNVYIIRVYSYYSGSSQMGEFEICILEPCIPSTADGTTTLGCPFVDLGGVGLSGTAPPPVDCTVGGVTIEASYLELGDTSSYSVEAIPYSPPYQFGCLANPVSVNQDDVFSPIVNLPFDFCFYGNTYNSLVIGSNGVISFDTSLANGASGYATNANIPNIVNASASGTGYYFGPSIFGVHHDVDPSIGGEIGYQLITLDTGCRALVAAWADVPMYLDNSILYTGMIVFYEDTNVIEVYVKEKNLDGLRSNGLHWNNGHASIGLQKDQSEGIAPPGRNAIDTDWIATEEAWRFVPDGASITDLKWYEGSISLANEIDDPDDDNQITVSPATTTTYIAEVTYTLCDMSTIVMTNSTDVTITGFKTWNGSVSTDWNNANNWTPTGVPLPTNCVTIPVTGNDPIMTSTIDGDGLNLAISNGAVLTQESNSTLTITEDINIDTGGTYDLEDSASLIQVDNVTNTVDGTFTMDRSTNIRSNDYVYWSSPTTAFNIEDVSSGTPNGFKYQWLPFVNRPVGIPGPLNYGEWESYNTGAMTIGKGYIIRGPDGHSSTPSPYTATFNGAPNNGDIIQTIERSTYTGADYSYQPYTGGDFLLVTSDDDNWNLIGNPYPSAINAVDFLTLPANSNIDGVVYLWTHGTDIGAGNSDPFYEDYTYNYNVADYIAYNSSGTSTPSGFGGNIGAGQGFFVLMNDDSGSTTESVTFNNNMRSSAYANDQFYRNSSINNNNENKNRIWLDYISPNGSTNTTLVAYVEGATNDADRMFDAINSKGFGLNLYSLIDNKNYLIQGRQLPFEESDIVPIGINITESGIQTIAINTIEGLFNESENDIFIEDLETGIIHNLKNSPYIFSSEEGIINNRFLLKYNNSILGVDDFNTSTGIKVFEESDQIVVKSYYESIQSIEVFDLLGRNLFSNKSINLDSIILKTLKPAERVLLLKIILTDGKQKIAKIIF